MDIRVSAAVVDISTAVMKQWPTLLDHLRGAATLYLRMYIQATHTSRSILHEASDVIDGASRFLDEVVWFAVLVPHPSDSAFWALSLDERISITMTIIALNRDFTRKWNDSAKRTLVSHLVAWPS